jgi:hypothetical protein
MYATGHGVPQSYAEALKCPPVIFGRTKIGRAGLV